MSEAMFTWDCLSLSPILGNLGWTTGTSATYFLSFSCEVELASKSSVALLHSFRMWEKPLEKGLSWPISPWLWAWHWFQLNTLIFIHGSGKREEDHLPSGLPSVGYVPFQPLSFSAVKGLFDTVFFLSVFNMYSFLSDLRFLSWVGKVRQNITPLSFLSS